MLCAGGLLQVLELAVSPVLDHVASAQVLQECSVFDVTRLGQMQLGITGMSLDKTYRYGSKPCARVQRSRMPACREVLVVSSEARSCFYN